MTPDYVHNCFHTTYLCSLSIWFLPVALFTSSFPARFPIKVRIFNVGSEVSSPRCGRITTWNGGTFAAAEILTRASSFVARSVVETTFDGSRDVAFIACLEMRESARIDANRRDRRESRQRWKRRAGITVGVTAVVTHYN